ncbi:MAG TPA: hypothetical protein VN857_06955, partial [Chthoniobacterales bacterium]|nr:hypothetical protein [Chthoniobacterales bacterium]
MVEDECYWTLHGGQHEWLKPGAWEKSHERCSDEVFALLWELSNYRIGFGARFAFLFATLVASNWGIRIARWLREWAR